MGHAVYSAPQLKGMQEIITLLVFAVFSIWYLDEQIEWNPIAGFILIIGAAIFIFWNKKLSAIRRAATSSTHANIFTSRIRFDASHETHIRLCKAGDIGDHDRHIGL